jgi:hypothetical protein
MDRAWLNDIAKRPRITPIHLLRSRRLIPVVNGSGLISSKREREIAEACLFCFGLSCRMQRLVSVVDDEQFDYDFVAHWEDDKDDDCYVPIQLKQVVSKHVNATASVQSVINSIAEKYDSSVAIRVSQGPVLDLDEITIPPDSRVAAIWVYAAVTPDGSRWYVAGNLVEPQPNLMWFFDYPA